jgi:GNAT superfamily N-acetyltransferase
MTDIIIREARESDLLTIRKLTLELIEAMENTEGINIKLTAENCRNLLSEANSYILVAEIEGIIGGFVNFTIRKTILHRGLSGLIDELIIAKGHRGKGIGKQLLSGAIEKSR